MTGRQRGEVITFYSYKGGTGRTMALANTAVLLARGGGNGDVLIMDWDLEAPGLHRFFPARTESAARPKLGTIDLLEDLSTRVGAVDARTLDEEQTLAIVSDISFDRYTVGRSNPEIDLLWAGDALSDDYAERVTDFDWGDLFRRSPYLFTALGSVLAERYRYVLIDSRTGLSDSSGVCTAMLPQKLVLVFTPNRQSLEGALERAKRAVSYRRHEGDLRPLLVYPLAARVELSEDDLRTQWRHGDPPGTNGYQPEFERVFREIYDLPECHLQTWFDDVQIQQSPRHAYGENIVVDEPGATTDRLSMARSYAGFARALADSDAPWKVERLADTRREDEAEQEVLALKRLATEHQWHESRSERGRRRLIVSRLFQAALLIAALVVEFVTPNYYLQQWVALAVGAVIVGAVEAVIAASGVAQWHRHAKLADLLAEEEFRYRARTRQYAETPTPAKLLAERVEDLAEEADRDWGGTSFLGLGPRPRPRRRLPPWQ